MTQARGFAANAYVKTLREQLPKAFPGTSFFFAVSSFGLKVAEWGYEIEATGLTSTVTESWQDQRGFLITTSGKVVTGVGDRAAYTETSIEKTLAALKAAAEAAG